MRFLFLSLYTYNNDKQDRVFSISIAMSDVAASFYPRKCDIITEKIRNLQLTIIYFFSKQLCVFFTPIDSSYYFVHKSIKVR